MALLYKGSIMENIDLDDKNDTTLLTEKVDKIQQNIDKFTETVNNLTNIIAQFAQTISTSKKPHKTTKKTVKKPAKKIIQKKKKVVSAKQELPQKLPQTLPQNDNIISLVPSKKTSRKGGNAPSKSGDKLCRTESINTANRPNLFLTDPIRNSCREDIKIDKLLSSASQPIPRRPAVKQYEVECIECGGLFVVSEGMFKIDVDTQEVRYVCDGCLANKRK